MGHFFPQDFISTINRFWFWEEYFVKSGKITFNLNESFSEYKINKNNFQYLSEKPISTSENEEDDDPFEKEFLNSLLENEENSLLENEENIFEENEEELTDEGEEDPHNLTENGKISCFW